MVGTKNPTKAKWRAVLSHAGFRRYFINTGWMFFGHFFSLLVAFFVGAWIARYLGPREYGLVNYAVSFAGLFSFIASLGADNILSRELVRRPEQRDELLGTAWRLKLIGGILAFICASGVALIVESAPLVRLLIFLFSFSFIFQASGVISIFFQAEVMAKRNIKVQVLAAAFSAFLKIGLIFLGLGIVPLILIYALESLFYALGLFYSYRVYGLKIRDWKFSPVLMKELWRDSWPLMLSGAAIVLFMRIDQVMIGRLLDASAVGFYAAGVKIAELWYFFPIVICSSLFPAIVRAREIDTGLYHRRLRRLYYLLGLSAVALAIPVSLLAEPIIFYLFGPDYGPAVDVLRIYVWSGVGGFLGIAVGQYLLAENFVFINLTTHAGGAVLNIVLNVFWIKSLGINGAALATLVSYLAMPLGLFIFFYFRRRFLEKDNALV